MAMAIRNTSKLLKSWHIQNDNAHLTSIILITFQDASRKSGQVESKEEPKCKHCHIHLFGATKMTDNKSSSKISSTTQREDVLPLVYHRRKQFTAVTSSLV
jgi:hypothetical protein